MSSLDLHIRRIKLQHKMSIIMLVIAFVVGKSWNFDRDPVIKDFRATAVVLSVTPRNSQGTGVGSNMSFATVQLDSGEKARVSMSRFEPSVGERISVQVSNLSSGKTRIVASNDY